MKEEKIIPKITEFELAMTPDEFEFIRKKLHLKINELKFLDKKGERHVLSQMIHENPVNPVLVYQLLAGRYAPIVVVNHLRQEYREKNAQKADFK